MDPRIADVIARIEQQLAADLSIPALAAGVNLSASRLAHLFTREIGISPARYVHRLRMERARELMERTFLSVKQVMLSVGINDPSHFARDFRRYHGVGPSQLRQRAWGARPSKSPRPTGGGDGQTPLDLPCLGRSEALIPSP